jgi:hypothetical protein
VAPVVGVVLTVLWLAAMVWLAQHRPRPVARILVALMVAGILLSLMRWIAPNVAYEDGCQYAGWLWWLVGCWS